MKSFNPIKTPLFKDGSEHERQKQINHFQERFNRDIFKKSPEEREALKVAQSQHPTGKGKPNNSHVNFRKEVD